MSHRFIVTGGAGFIGSNLVAALNKRGHSDITIVDHLNHEAKKANLSRLTHAAFVDKGEFTSRLLTGQLGMFDCLFHLGACSSTLELDETYLQKNNVEYTQHLCDWSLANGVRFIYASSAATYGDGSLGYSDRHNLIPSLRPLNPYGQSKQRFDLWALESGKLDRIVGLKYFNVYGPGEDHKEAMRSLVHKAYHQIVATGSMTLFRSHRPDYRDGEQVRDFIYVDDAVAMTLFFYDHPELHGMYNVGTGRARSWADLARALFVAMGKKPEITFVDIPEAIRDRYQYHTQAEMEKLTSAGYTQATASIESGVERYVKEWLSNRAIAQS